MSSSNHSHKSFLYCSLLALQFGLQPIIANKFTSSKISKTSIVIATEAFKIIISFFTIMFGPKGERESFYKSWSFKQSIKVAAIPASLYAIQNLLVQYGYVWLDPMSFNVLNQSKTLSAAFFLWIILDKKQSKIQLFALLLLLLAALALNMKKEISDLSNEMYPNYHWGFLFVAIASTLSGLSAALTQKVLNGSNPRPPLFYSAEMAFYGIVFLFFNIVFNNDTSNLELFSNWQLTTFIPVISNAFGGLIVGLVTKYAGGVVKGFALIAGILITALFSWIFDGKPLQDKHYVAIVLVSVAIYLHSKYPFKELPDKQKSI